MKYWVEDKTHGVWVNREKNSVGFLEAHHSRIIFILSCGSPHTLHFKALNQTNAEPVWMMRRISVTSEPTPIKAEEFATMDLHRCTPHTCLPVSGPLTVNRLICLMAVAYSLQARDYGDNIKLSGFVQLSGVLLQCNQQWNGRGPLGWKHKSAAGQQSWKPVNGRFAP